MGMLYNKGLLKRDEKFMHQSILGTIFEGSVGQDVKVGEFNAIIPRVKSRGYITGYTTLIIDSDDPVKDGFLLR
jgi:proline racemase